MRFICFYSEHKVEAVEKFDLEMFSTTTAPIQKTNTGMTKPDVTGKVVEWDWEWEEEEEEMATKGSAIVEEVKEPLRTFEDIFEFDE